MGQDVIVLLESLPHDWLEGAQLEIDITLGEKLDSSLDIDEWVRAMDALCADSSEDEERYMKQAIDQHREQAKALARREMGLTA